MTFSSDGKECLDLLLLSSLNSEFEGVAFFELLTWTWLLSIMDNRRKKMYSKDLPTFYSLLSPKKDERILDVGAGLGTVASILAESTDDVFALEPNDERLNFMKQKHPSVKSFSATASQIPFPTSYFDKIYVLVAFHHFPDQDDALEEFRRVTKKGGLILIQELDPSKDGKFLNFFETKILRNNVVFLRSDQLRSLVVEHGFAVLDEKRANRGYFLLARNEKSSDSSEGWVDFSSAKTS
jgi:ubiquinone/menaquinone biosynthesis C-methylase UbiE